MFGVFLAAVVCSALERALLESGDVDAAVQLADSRETARDYFYGFFVKKVLLGREDAFADLLDPACDGDARNIVLATVSMESGRTNEEHAYAAELFLDVAARVSKKYLRNPHRFLATESFRRLQREGLSPRRLGDIVTMVYSGDAASAKLFLSLLDAKKIAVGDHVAVLEFLAREGHARAFGYLGEAYYHGLGVRQSLDRAMYFFSRGKEMHDGMGLSGVAKVLMSSEYRDYENARGALASTGRHVQTGESEYLQYVLTKTLYPYDHSAKAHLDAGLVFGYLPAIFRDGVRYWDLKEHVNACIRFFPVVEYSDIVYGLRKLAEQRFAEGRYRPCVLALLMCAELGSVASMKNAVYVLERHAVFENQDGILAGLYRRLIAKGNARFADRLGDAYFYGRGVEQSHADAFALYMSSALLRDPEGFYNTAYMYEHGLGVEKSVWRALGWILKIQPTDDMYLLLLYTYVRLVLQPVGAVVLNRYVVSAVAGLLVVRKIYRMRCD